MDRGAILVAYRSFDYSRARAVGLSCLMARGDVERLARRLRQSRQPGAEVRDRGTAFACRVRTMPERDRRSFPRTMLKVVHRHRMGDRSFRRVSELVFVNGRPRAMLEWVDLGGVRSPLYIADLDPAKLRKSSHARNTYYYDGET
ncbi:MAG: hypothetical protein ABR570_15240, partial [Burkholderiales bacterium]